MSNVVQDAETLMSVLANPTLDQETIFAILDQHGDCFSAELCPICEYLEDESLGDILIQLARNPSINKDTQLRLLDEAYKWQGAEIGVKLSLARNPAIDSQVRSILLLSEIWYGYGYGHELISDLIEAAAGNPNFPDDEIDKFEDECAEFYDYPKEE
jgi:hypothetical protein